MYAAFTVVGSIGQLSVEREVSTGMEKEVGVWGGKYRIHPNPIQKVSEIILRLYR